MFSCVISETAEEEMKLQAQQSELCSLYLAVSEVEVQSWAQDHKREGPTFTGSQAVLEVPWLSYLLDLNSYSHKKNSVRKSDLSHLDVPLSLEKAPQIPPVMDENHTHLCMGQE